MGYIKTIPQDKIKWNEYSKIEDCKFADKDRNFTYESYAKSKDITFLGEVVGTSHTYLVDIPLKIYNQGGVYLGVKNGKHQEMEFIK